MTALEVTDLRHRYGDRESLRGVGFSVAEGDLFALLGPNGGGKSTLFRIISTLMAPSSGTVEVFGIDVVSRPAEARRRMGVVFQFGDLVPELTLVENVMLPLQLLGRRTRSARARALELLDRLGIADLADSRTGAVSGGEAQRAAVARALAHEPAVVLADEPTGALDSVNAEAVLDALVVLARDTGAALLVVTHDNVVASHLDTLVTLHDGAILSNIPAGTA